MTGDPLGVGFDFDHTLGVDNGLETVAFYRLAAELGRPIDENDSAWAAFIAELLRRFRATSIGQDAAVALFAERLGVAPDAARGERYREICYGLVDTLVEPVDGARDLLAQLEARGVRTAILTNGWSPLQALKVARALEYAGPVLVSDTLGMQKPDAAAFEKLIDALAIGRERVWYVGDNPKTDIAGARAAGVHAVWFDWESVPYPPDASPPEVRIASLRELLDVLPGHAGEMENIG